VRGLVGGVRWFGGYAVVLLADGVARLAVAAPLVLVASAHLAGASMVAAGVAGAIVPFAFGRDRLRRVLAGRGSEALEVRSALAFAAPATAIAAADQLLVNGGPLLVIVDGGAHAAKAAGVVFAATMLVRAPIYVFTGLAASMLPNLTALAAGGDKARFRAAVSRGSLALVGTGLALVALVALGGEQAMLVLYGHRYAAGLGSLVLLAVGAACYLAAGTASQGLLALDRGLAAAVAWVAGAVSFVALFAALPGSELGRVSLAFALGMAICTTLIGIAVAREAWRA
jgi:O-antigen/teichoic acid export membrane protein